jgi:hypothetical protein
MPRKQFWEEHISQWKASERSQAEYCRLNKISLKSFQYWKGKSKRNAPPLALIEVPVSRPLPVLSAPQLCLLVDRYRIEIGKGFDPEDLERVVRILERI